MRLFYNPSVNNLFLVSSFIGNSIVLHIGRLQYSRILPAGTFLSLNKKSTSLKFTLMVKSYKRAINMLKFFYTFYAYFWKSHVNSTGFYTTLDLVGLGFRLVRISDRVFFFDLGMASGFYFLVPSAVRVFISSSSRKMLLFSTNYSVVNGIIASLFLLRKVNFYKISGFKPTRSVIRLRAGKQR